MFEPTGNSCDLSRAELEMVLPHRDPFLLLDRVIAINVDLLEAVGSRHIDKMDPILRGHFPETPVYPGVLQLEIIGQLGLCLLDVTANRAAAGQRDHPRQVRIVKIHHAVFLAEVGPEDDLAVLAKIVECDEYTAICAGQIVRDDTICTFAVMEVYFVEA
jgi:3-hydroxyacyl-[acyl-carrier-protein] dehydratase